MKSPFLLFALFLFFLPCSSFASPLRPEPASILRASGIKKGSYPIYISSLLIGPTCTVDLPIDFNYSQVQGVGFHPARYAVENYVFLTPSRKQRITVLGDECGAGLPGCVQSGQVTVAYQFEQAEEISDCDADFDFEVATLSGVPLAYHAKVMGNRLVIK